MKLPNHVAIIMDGNGRWGLKHYKNRLYGHNHGAKNIENIIKEFVKLRIKNLTLYSLSYDNVKKRSNKEINNIYTLFEKHIKNNVDFFKKKKIELKIIGELSGLPKNLKKIILKCNKELKTKNRILKLNVAFNYSSKKEIIHSCKKILQQKSIINLQNISKNLFTYESKDPEIVIRTGGKKRISDFLLWQSAYSEFFFIDKLWPDFNKMDLKKIILKYNKVKRNFGK